MKKKIKLIYILLYLVISLYGCVTDIAETSHALFYFTILSNIFCFGMMVTELITFDKKVKPGIVRLQFLAMMMILLTALLYNFLLSNVFSFSYWQDYLTVIMHLILPVMFVGYFFLYTERQLVHKSDLIYCAVIPYSYITLIMLRHCFMGDNWFPYFFLDLGKQGVDGILRWVSLLSLLFIIISYFLIALCKRFPKSSIIEKGFSETD